MRSFSGLQVTGATPALRRSVYYLTHMVLTMERAPFDSQLRVHFISLPHMHQLNSTYKGVSRPTDVLTFTPASAADSFVNDLLFGEEDDVMDSTHGADAWAPSTTPTGSASVRESLTSSSCCPSSSSSSVLSPAAQRAELVDLGDIFVSLEYMQQRCAALPSRSLPLVPYFYAAMIHATLHALGYDHTTPAELRHMVRQEQRLGCRLAMLCRRHPEYFSPLDVWTAQSRRRSGPAGKKAGLSRSGAELW